MEHIKNRKEENRKTSNVTIKLSDLVKSIKEIVLEKKERKLKVVSGYCGYCNNYD